MRMRENNKQNYVVINGRRLHVDVNARDHVCQQASKGTKGEAVTIQS